MRVLALSALVVASCMVGACVAVLPGEAPTVPPVRAERIPQPPASAVTLIWRPGHWDWDGSDYRWAEGEWVSRAGHGPLWQDGFWRRAGNGYIWQPAHWI